jgi:multimeric flavodoxin WrbA
MESIVIPLFSAMNSPSPSVGSALVLVIVASMNEPSNGNVLADNFIEGVKSVSGVRFEKIRLKELSLHHFTLSDYDEESCESDYLRLKTLIQDAAGVVFVTPIWNFSVPAHLKNLVDRIGTFGLDHETHSKGQFKGKPFGFIYTGGAPMIAWQALMYLTTLHMAEAFKYYGGTVALRHFEPKCDVARGKFGLVVDKRPKSLALMTDYGKRFAGIAKNYGESGTLPLGRRLWQKWFEFLYRVGNRIMYPISKVQ